MTKNEIEHYVKYLKTLVSLDTTLLRTSRDWLAANQSSEEQRVKDQIKPSKLLIKRLEKRIKDLEEEIEGLEGTGK